MAHDAPIAGGASPALSGRASPNPRAGRKVEEGMLPEALQKGDKALRRYAAGIDKALATFESSHQDWADYIAFLGRLLKAIQAVKETVIIPHSHLVSLRLAQCLNPNLPSGVHQKALEVYAHIFELLRSTNLGRDLQIFLPGLLPVLSFASLTVRPVNYAIFEDHIQKLDQASLRPALKSIILALLPGIEDETSEDFERGIAVLDKLRRLRGGQEHGVATAADEDSWQGYFWQCFFLAVVTGDSRRQGALAYLNRRLPSFKNPRRPSTADSNGHAAALEALKQGGDADVATRPEPGLLVRCFAAGLRDQHILVQRGFLDLLVTNLPLDSHFLQQTAKAADLDLLVAAAVTVVLRRDMSLNRRLWAWFLGPEPSSAVEDVDNSILDDQNDAAFSNQASYFQRAGASALRRCFLQMFAQSCATPAEKARPFRIASALMDRWEIGGLLIPSILIPGLRAAYEYSSKADKTGGDEVVKSASLFFDGIESSLIWAQIVGELTTALKTLHSDCDASEQTLRFLIFVISRFNIREEDMLTIHIPQALLVALYDLATAGPLPAQAHTPLRSMFELALSLTTTIPDRAVLEATLAENGGVFATLQTRCEAYVTRIKQASQDMEQSEASADGPHRGLLLFSASLLYQKCLSDPSLKCFAGQAADVLINLLARDQDWSGIAVDELVSCMAKSLEKLQPCGTTQEDDFALALSMSRLWTTISENKYMGPSLGHTDRPDVETPLINYLWLHLVPTRSKHHVDAVRMLWTIRKVLIGERDIDLSIFVSQKLVESSAPIEDIGRFMTLWEHTIQENKSKSDRKPSLGQRRPSNYLTLDISTADAETVLSRPLMIVLDNLSDGTTDASAVVATWLRTLPSLDRIMSILIAQLEKGLSLIKAGSVHVYSKARRGRSEQQYVQDIDVSLQRLLGLLSNSSPYTWNVLADIKIQEDKSGKATSIGTQSLAGLAVDLMLCIDCGQYERSQRLLLRLLNLLLVSPNAQLLRDLQVEKSLLQLLAKSVTSAQGSLQVEVLRVLPKALRIKEGADVNYEDADQDEDALGFSIFQPQPPTTGAHLPPAELLDCIKAAIKTPGSRLYLEYWIKFLSEVLPLYSQAILGALIPLVECFCTEVTRHFECVKTMATQSMTLDQQMPTAPLFDLLHGLELILANAHRTLEPVRPEPIVLTALSPTAQSYFGGGAMIPTPGDPSKTAKSNSRLTVIICLHDAVEVCFKMWSWASYGIESQGIDPASAATAAFNSQKIRTRAKKMLEHLFLAEGLESLETLIALWAKSKGQTIASNQFAEEISLINALAASRPRIAMPLILNALYSRTNIDALDVGLRSTLTCDLTATDLASFLLKYVATLEDDALEEIWSDYSAFMKDVLLNPSPHKVVLPLYIELTALLAEKVDNTNYGERQRIHRELADFFSRLLTATFTNRPANGLYESPMKGGARVSEQTNDLLSSLIVVTPKLQSVLETTDRISIAVNTITTHAISPSFHARTFPENIRPELLRLTGLIAAQSPDAKLWKREVGDAFLDARIFTAQAQNMSEHWFPMLKKWSTTEKTIISDTLSRIVAPSAAAMMFGVGANSARLAADKTAQHNLRRVALLLLANDQEAFSSQVQLIDTKTTELCTATLTSAPSCATRADVFMLWRAMFLSTDSMHMSGMWPTITATLQTALLSACPGGAEQETYNNLSLLQACKLLDMFVTIQPDDFQLQEWLFLTNTIDAVFTSTYYPTALVDEVAQTLVATAPETNGSASEDKLSRSKVTVHAQGLRRPMLSNSGLDLADVKAMAREDFVRQVLLPFFNGLAVTAYETTYQMGKVDWEACRRDLIEDLMNDGTVV